MEYIKIRFGKNLGEMHDRLQRTMDEMFRRVNPMLVLPEQVWRPQMDVYETPQAIIIAGELSGVRKEDLEIVFDRKAIKISGVRRKFPHIPGMRYHLAEIVYGSFERILLLPAPVNPKKVTASYANGLLKITMGKMGRDQVHRIKIDTE
ncbi:MAG: Hsp20/alpha crystallin family protein [Deltaproteobacteria bacterium]|nr:Hsp20/alpha crystallin family protein [Deltaproteobacteria bacterium]